MLAVELIVLMDDPQTPLTLPPAARSQGQGKGNKSGATIAQGIPTVWEQLEVELGSHIATV